MRRITTLFWDAKEQYTATTGARVGHIDRGDIYRHIRPKRASWE
jgi:hypothetical protein